MELNFPPASPPLAIDPIAAASISPPMLQYAVSAFEIAWSQLEDSDDSLPSLSEDEDITHASNGLAPLTTEECIDVLELSVELWTPMKLFGKGQLAAFIWDLSEWAEDTFTFQMAAIRKSGTVLIARLLMLDAECFERHAIHRRRISLLVRDVREVISYVDIRVYMVESGLTKNFPGILELARSHQLV